MVAPPCSEGSEAGHAPSPQGLTEPMSSLAAESGAHLGSTTGLTRSRVEGRRFIVERGSGSESVYLYSEAN